MKFCSTCGLALGRVREGVLLTPKTGVKGHVLTGINSGFMPSTRGAGAGIRVRIRRTHRGRSNDEENPEQHREY